ncbi:MAG TPA: carboxypeptidase-like regulatory domain-containing protein [Myxococcales bacterium]
MKRALAVALVLLAGAIAAFFFWPDAGSEPVRNVAEGAYSPPPDRTAGSAIVRPGAAHEATGRVVDARGRGIGGAQVFLAREGAESMGDEGCDCPVDVRPLLDCGCPAGASQVAGLVMRREGELQPEQTATADADGSFRIADPPAGAFLVWATAPGYAPAFRHGVEAGKQVELALGPAQTLWGKVIDESGAPVPKALLTAVFGLLPRFQETTAAADGTFRLDSLGLGPHFLVAVAPGFLPSGTALGVPTGAATTVVLSRPRTLTGTVRDRKQPAKGAAIRLTAEHFARLAPAAEGTFRLENLSPGSYTVAATLGSRFASAQVQLDKPVIVVELVLDEALSVRGRVFDDAGSPIPGSRVVAELDSHRVAEGGSDDAGAFSLTGVPRGARLVASHEGFESASARVGDEGADVELVLHPQAMVTGIVVSPQDEPLPQVQVVARGAGHGVAVSDASGRFKMALPTPGPVTLLAHHSTYGAGEVSIEAPAAGVRLKLSTMGALRARLVDETGKPVIGGKATAWKDNPALQRFDTFSSDVPSGEDGLVVLAGLPAGPHRVRFSARGYQGAERRNVPIPESGVLDLGDVALESGKDISGTVLNDDGTPVQGAFVHARAKGARATEGVQTGRDGTFVIPGLKDGPYTVSAFLEKAVAEAQARAGDKDVVLRLPAPARLRGRVVETDGRPIPRFSVDGTSVEALDGRFEVPARAWRESVFFRVGAEGHLSTFKQAKLGTGGIAEAGDVVLERALAIEGTISDEAGNPVAGAAVMVADREELLAAQDEAAARSVSAANGRFRLDGFGSGAVTLVARRGNLVAEETVLLDDENLTDVVLTLKGKGSIEGLVRGPDGKPVIAEVHNRSASTTSDAQGRYRLDALVPGSYLVLAVLEADSYRSSSREVQVKSGEATRLDFDLNVGATLKVTVPGATTGMLHLARLNSVSLSSLPQTAGVIQGQATVAGLPEGHYGVYFYGQGATGHEDLSADGNVDVPASGEVQLTLTPRVLGERQ